MPLLDDQEIAHLLALAHAHTICSSCGHRTAMEYCRSCDEFFWIHAPGCLMFEDKHYGHRLTITPFVEDRSK